MQVISQRRDYFWNTLGVLAQNAISPLLLVVITRVNGIFDAGTFSFAFAVSIILWAFGMWGSRTYQVSDVTREFSHRSYIAVRLVLAMAMLVMALLFSVTNGYSADKTSIIIALVAFKAIESIADAVYGVLQVHGRLYITGRSLLYKAVAGFGVFVALDIWTKDILLASVGIVAINLLFLLFYDLPRAKEHENIMLKASQMNKYAREALVIMRRTAPVFVVAFLAMFSLNVPRYFIDMYHEQQLGYFGIIAMPITLIALVMTFVLQPNVMELTRLYATRSYDTFGRLIRNILSLTLGIGIVILAVAYTIGVPVLNVIFGVDFSDYLFALVIITAGGVANAIVSIYINILTIMRHFKAQFYVLILSNILLAILSMFVVKDYGLTGGALLFAGVNIAQTILLAIVYRTTLSRSS